MLQPTLPRTTAAATSHILKVLPPRLSSQIVGHLAKLYMSGDQAVRLTWNESEGGEYCGDVLYRLYRQRFVGVRLDEEGEPYDAYDTRWTATHAGYLAGIFGCICYIEIYVYVCVYAL